MSCIFCKDEHLSYDPKFQNMEYNGCFRCASCKSENSICRKCLSLHILKASVPFGREYILCPICERDGKINKLIWE